MVVFTVLQRRLSFIRKKRTQSINKVELNAIKSKIQTLKGIVKCFEDWDSHYGLFNPSDCFEEYLFVLRDVLMRSEDYVTNQEIDDMQLEIKRLHRMVQFSNVVNSDNFRYAIREKSEIEEMRHTIELKLLANSRYSDVDDNIIENELKNLSRKIGLLLEISQQEKIEIVQAIRLAKGHWFKCPNGHPYVIGECGGAMEVAKCFCGEQIGGYGHHLLSTNQFAGEMDGAARHAWPGGLH